MQTFFIGLVLMIVLPWSIFACRGCHAQMESMRAELEIERSAYEKDADRRREAVRAELADEEFCSEAIDRQRRDSVIRELDTRKAAQAAEISRLQKAIELRTADREFRRVVNGKLSAEYKEYQMIGSDLSFARNLLAEAAEIAAKAGKATPDDFRSTSAKVKKAQSDLEQIGRDILEAAALLQIEEKQFSP